jgi:hypothetical protein
LGSKHNLRKLLPRTFWELPDERLSIQFRGNEPEVTVGADYPPDS